MSTMKFLMMFVTLGGVRSEFATFRWKSCDTYHKAIRVNTFIISPLPITTPGKIHVSFDADILQRIDLAYLELNLTRISEIGAAVHVSCFGTYGSCNLDICSDLDNLRGINRTSRLDPISDLLVTIFQVTGLVNDCPIQKQHVAVTDRILQIPKYSRAINFLFDGDYNVTVNVKDPISENSLGCFEFIASIKRKELSGFLFGSE